MEILENYKNLFLHPRDFASDKLDESWPWWVYALIVLGLNIAVAFLQTRLGVSLYEAYVTQVGAFIFAFLGIFIINQPFRKKLKISEYYQVNLAFQAYGAFVYILIYVIMAAVMLISPLLVLLPALLSPIVGIWLIVSYCKALSELHNVSAWAIFAMMIVATIILTIISFFFLSSWIFLS